MAGPPAAYLDNGTTHVPLAISSWCLGSRCGAPISGATKVTTVKRGGVVRCVLRFDPASATLTVDGRRVPVITGGRQVTWHAYMGGGITLRVNSGSGWVVYVGRLKVD
jgi:hypothetical protein